MESIGTAHCYFQNPSVLYLQYLLQRMREFSDNTTIEKVLRRHADNTHKV